MTLAEHRELFTDSPDEPNAAFLSALARFRARGSDTDRVRFGRGLTAALAHADPSRFFSFVGYLLVGQAYEEIGLPSEMEAVFETAIRTGRDNYLRQQMAFVLAQRYVNEGRLEDAQRLLEQLADSHDPVWARQAKMEMARLAMSAGRLNECLDLCYELIAEAEAADEKAEILKLMGSVYQKQQDYYRAAICFAGLVPTVPKEATR